MKIIKTNKMNIKILDHLLNLKYNKKKYIYYVKNQSFQYIYNITIKDYKKKYKNDIEYFFNKEINNENKLINLLNFLQFKHEIILYVESKVENIYIKLYIDDKILSCNIQIKLIE